MPTWKCPYCVAFKRKS